MTRRTRIGFRRPGRRENWLICLRHGLRIRIIRRKNYGFRGGCRRSKRRLFRRRSWRSRLRRFSRCSRTGGIPSAERRDGITGFAERMAEGAVTVAAVTGFGFGRLDPALPEQVAGHDVIHIMHAGVRKGRRDRKQQRADQTDQQRGSQRHGTAPETVNGRTIAHGRDSPFQAGFLISDRWQNGRTGFL